MKILYLADISLDLYDEGGAAAGTAASDGTAGDSDMASSADTQQGKNTGEKVEVRYGRQPEETTSSEKEAPDAGEKNSASAALDTLEARTKEFDELINSKYKDIYTKRTQDMINRRFAQSKETETALKNLRNEYGDIADMLRSRYRLSDDAELSDIKAALENDETLLMSAADDAGLNVNQYKEFERLRRQNAAYEAARQNDIRIQQAQEKAAKWYEESKALKAKFPQFDLDTELSDPNFQAAINAGVPMELVYKGKYYDMNLDEAAKASAAKTEKAVVENIRAKGNRPAENGTASQSAFILKNDPSKLTLKDFDEIARRVSRGEKISF